LLGVTRPHGASISHHLSTVDAVDVAEQVEPELLVLTHLGLKLIGRGPSPGADHVEAETGVRTVAACDLLQVVLGDDGIDITDPDTSRAKG
jgi:phosphoribosyl 1,2-cyclic phosphodiesterase